MSATKSGAGSALPRLSRMGTAALAGAVAGLVTLGGGSRLVMRIMALTSNNIGMLTENGNRAGDFTVGGTLFLLLAGAFGGAALGLLHLLIRRFLPTSPRREALMLGVLSVVVAQRVILAPDNIDFERFGPALLAVVLFLSCLFGFGVGFSVIYERLGRLVSRLQPGSLAARIWVVISAGAGVLTVLLAAALGIGSWQGVVLVVLAGVAFWASNRQWWQGVIGSSLGMQIGRLTLASLALLGMVATAAIAIQVVLQAG